MASSRGLPRRASGAVQAYFGMTSMLISTSIGCTTEDPAAARPQPAAPANEAAPLAPEPVGAAFRVETERFADVRILRYRAPGFEALDLGTKRLLYYLYEAALTRSRDHLRPEVSVEPRDQAHARADRAPLSGRSRNARVPGPRAVSQTDLVLERDPSSLFERQVRAGLHRGSVGGLRKGHARTVSDAFRAIRRSADSRALARDVRSGDRREARQQGRAQTCSRDPP